MLYRGFELASVPTLENYCLGASESKDLKRILVNDFAERAFVENKVEQLEMALRSGVAVCYKYSAGVNNYYELTFDEKRQKENAAKGYQVYNLFGEFDKRAAMINFHGYSITNTNHRKTIHKDTVKLLEKKEVRKILYKTFADSVFEEDGMNQLRHALEERAAVCYEIQNDPVLSEYVTYELTFEQLRQNLHHMAGAKVFDLLAGRWYKGHELTIDALVFQIPYEDSLLFPEERLKQIAITELSKRFFDNVSESENLLISALMDGSAVCYKLHPTKHPKDTSLWVSFDPEGLGYKNKYDLLNTKA